MSDDIKGELIPASCPYCGRDNVEQLSNCRECGTALVASTEPKQKSKVIAVILVLLFGPLGLLYLGLEGFLVLVVLVGAVFFALPLILHLKMIIFVEVSARILSAVWAIQAIDRCRATPDPMAEAEALLDEAARLENGDTSGAVAKYEEIVRLFPNTLASREATQSIQVLTSSKEGHRD